MHVAYHHQREKRSNNEMGVKTTTKTLSVHVIHYVVAMLRHMCYTYLMPIAMEQINQRYGERVRACALACGCPCARCPRDLSAAKSSITPVRCSPYSNLQRFVLSIVLFLGCCFFFFSSLSL